MDGGKDRTLLVDGTIVRGYRVEFLSEGGFGTVYKASRGGKVFVLKEVPADRPPMVLALTQEKGLLERIQHPQIVKFVNLFEEDGYYYLVLEYIDGLPLEALVEEDRRIDEAEARRWGIQLCDIFEYLHGLQPPVIYPDLKPANILLKDDRVYLIDFGIARIHKGDRAHDTKAYGSYHTASPEHFGAAETDRRSDVFSLGATLYDLLAGGRMRKDLASQLPPIRDLRPDVSEDLESVEVLRARKELPAEDAQRALKVVLSQIGAKKTLQLSELYRKPVPDRTFSRDEFPTFRDRGRTFEAL